MAITIPAALKRDLLLKSAMRVFKNRILPILAFATKFQDKPLEGTNIIQVPYYPLATGASTDFVNGTGYTTYQAQTIQTKSVTVNKRKYRALDLASIDYNRQPFLDFEKSIGLEAAKLADDVLADVFSLVTAANYASTTTAAMLASAFDVDDALLLRRLCNEANWPMPGRSLVLDATFEENLLKDARVQSILTAGQTGAVSEAKLPRVAGFDVYPVALLPQNGAEKIAGMAAIPSALFFASAPVTPHPVLLRNTVEYQAMTDPDTGLTLEYRMFGDPVKDTIVEVIEVNYGYAVGEAAALKRIVIP
jgi:hypothetical protein